MCMGKLRHSFGSELGLRSSGFSALWVIDFPLLEWDEDEGRCIAMHHPFTSPAKGESTDLFMTVDPAGDPAPLEKIRANAYDMVLNGIEAGGGSIRITDPATQARMFELLNMSQEEYEKRFGFLMEAFRHGAPPHGGLAFGLDRLCTIIGEATGIPQQLDRPTLSIRDYMAFPKTKGGQDAMIKAPCGLPKDQLAELYVQTTVEPEPDEDDKADALHLPVFETVLSDAWSQETETTVDATLASRYLERFADHAVSIAKKMVYLATGEWNPQTGAIQL